MDLYTAIDGTNIKKNLPKSSEISGNEMFAEQISVIIAGNTSLVRQSYITNDTNVFEKMDLSDPAFFASAFYISVSNKIRANLDPFPITTSDILPFGLNFETMSGFLYYDNSSDYDMIQIRKTRAIDILRDLFDIDFVFYNIIENSSVGYYYPFYGFTPDWHNYFAITVDNLPTDGYWGTFDKNRLISDEYISNKHLSSSLFYFNNFSMVEGNLETISGHKISINFDLSSLDQSNSLLSFNTILNTDNQNSNPTVDENPNVLIPDEQVVEKTEDNETNLSYLDGLQNVVVFSVQYEGDNSGISYLGNNNFQFDLFRALNYDGPSIGISSKSYNSIDGISLSLIDINLLSSEVTSTSPSYFEFDDYNIERIENILFLFDDTFDLSNFKNYSFKVDWNTNESLTKLSTIPQNLHNDSDPVNFLSLLTSEGFSKGIPGSYVEPIAKFEVNYHLLTPEPSLFTYKKITEGNSSQILFDENNPTIEYIAKNRGNEIVWGKEFNVDALGFSNDPTKEITILDINQNFFELLGLNSEDIVRTTETLGYNITSLFHHDNPRLFNLDLNNTGTFSTTYPDLTNIIGNIEVIYPYSPEFTQLLIDNPAAYGAVANNPQQFNSSDSIFNPENWKLRPGENITIDIDSGIGNIVDKFDTYISTYISSLDEYYPIIAVGEEEQISSVSNTYLNDSITWNLISEQLGDSHEIQTYFILNIENQTERDRFSDYNFDGMNFESFFKNSNNATSITIEIFNYNYDGDPEEEGYFEQIPNIYQTSNPERINFTISNVDYNLSNYIDTLNNYTVILRVTFTNTEEFSISLDFFSLNFQDRINQQIFLEPTVIQYNTYYGNEYISKSNSLILNTDEAASLTAYLTISEYNNLCGDIICYNLSLSNLGNFPAFNVSINVNQPGIMNDLKDPTIKIENDISIITATVGNFTISNGNLFSIVSTISPGQTIENISFSFHIPNSRYIPAATICWNNNLDNDSMNQTMNQIVSNYEYISAPIYGSYNNQNTGIPKKSNLKIEYLSDFSLSSPAIKDIFLIELEIANIGDSILYDIRIPINNSLTGISLLNQTNYIWITSINPNNSVHVFLEYRKDSYLGYMLPPLFVESSMEYNYTNFFYSSPLLLGVFGLEIQRNIEKLDVSYGTIISIEIVVSNTGNIQLGNFTIDDSRSYDADGFILHEGNMIQKENSLQPGESISYTYTLKTLRNKGIYTINPAEIIYYFIEKHSIQNEPLIIKVQEPYYQILIFIFFPIILGGFAIWFTYFKKLEYSQEDFDLERREKLMFGQSLREISWRKKNLQSFLEEQTNPLKNEEEH